MKPALHFVGFRGEEYHSATRVWGLSDFIHRRWDLRARREIAPDDTIVFARDYPEPCFHSGADLVELDDPAYWEQRGKFRPRARPLIRGLLLP